MLLFTLPGLVATSPQPSIGNELHLNFPDFATSGLCGKIQVTTVDPGRLQSDDPAAAQRSMRIQNLTTVDPPVSCHASCNVILRKPLRPAIARALGKI